MYRLISPGKDIKEIKPSYGFKFAKKSDLVGSKIVSAENFGKVTRLDLEKGTIAVDEGTIVAAGLPAEIEANQWEVTSVNPLECKLVAKPAPPKPKK